MLPPFREHRWRGCVVDRDKFDNTRMPQELFEAIVDAAHTTELRICGYSEAGTPDPIASIAATWDDYSKFMLGRDNYSPEYVVFSSARDWAILAEFDVTILGATVNVADQIDAQLSSRGQSLKKITEPMLSGENTEVVRYFRAVADGY